MGTFHCVGCFRPGGRQLRPERGHLLFELEPWRQLPRLLEEAFTPLADVEETDDAYLVEVELPGIKKDDIDIQITGRRLQVSGERKEKERVGILRRRERVVGQFHYEVLLPGDVEEDAVEANLDNGVLTVRVPKPASARPRRIQVR
ncbi:MAG: Hsp20/alpha crystallin family protein [Actinobacteria bacterium]|nr:Hsp20/alpha crystallin family protein [Actinomycetota bacterium]MBW3651008.1 Hsp20/alpha crystallin family protein [Actinomycetota bacterium]